MTPDERQLISGLFDRMRGFQLPEKDREADALINQSVQSNPDAAYMLVQSVLVQEQALQAANNRVQELEDRVRDLEEAGQRPQQSSGGFLGGLFGGGSARPEPRPAAATRGAGSVPNIGSRAASGPFGAGPAGQPGPGQPMQAAPQGGGFMRSAMTTAAGVAGGMLLAEGIKNMMGTAHATPAATEAGKQEAADKKQDEQQDAQNQHDDDDDDHHQNASDDGDWGGGDWGGGDMDV